MGNSVVGDGDLMLIIFGGIVSLAWVGALIYFIIDRPQKDDYFSENSFKKGRLAWNLISTIVSFVLIVVAGLMVGFGTGHISNNIKESYNYEEYKIVSLERNSEVKGSFCIGTGHIDTQTYYYTYTIRGNNYKLEKYNTNYTYLHETDEITPSIYKHKESGDKYFYYIIYCPVGTIVKEYHA